MHSTEVSGARTGSPENPDSRAAGTWGSGALAGAARLLHTVFPDRAMLLALGVAIAFAAFDGVRSFAEAEEDVALLANLAAAQMAPRAADAPRGALSAPLPSGLATIINGEDGTVLASSVPQLAAGERFSPEHMPAGLIWARASLGAGYGDVVVAMSGAAVTLPVFMRAATLALVVGLVGAQIRRRRRPVEAAEPAAPALAGDDEWLHEIPHGVARWNAQGRLVVANATFFRLLRLDADDFAPGAPYGAVSKRIAGRISARPVLDQNHQRVVDVEREDGSAIMLDERGCADGGFITTVTDITERRVADRMLANMREEQRQLARRYHEEKIRAEAANRAKTAFLAHLSHDIRTPLNHIIGFADLMRMETYGPLGDRKYQDYLGDIKNSGERLLSAFAQILEYAELEGGRKALKAEPIPVEALLRDVVGRFREQAKRSGIRLNLATSAQAIVAADRHCVERMLCNLVDNAIRFTPRGGEVRVGSWSAPGGVVIEVADTGVGIPEDQLEKLTQPFALSDAAFTKTSAGAGLGLAIARTIAELSGGKLAIESAAAVGTTVAVSLPLAADAEPEPQAAHTPTTARAA